MSPFYLTAEQQYWRYGQTDPEIVTEFSLHIHKFILHTCILIETVHDFWINIHIAYSINSEWPSDHHLNVIHNQKTKQKHTQFV